MATTCTAQGVLHVGAVTLPALFAALETTAGSFIGRALLRAAVAGYVVGPRVGP